MNDTPSQFASRVKSNRLAITSMTLGIGSLFEWIFLGVGGQLSLALLTLPLSVAAVIFGHLAFRKIKQTGLNGKAFARTGLITGYLSIGLLIAFYAVVIYALWVWGNGGKGFF